jgi:hypothetical protein
LERIERKRLRVDGAFDIECTGWDNFLVGVTITAGLDVEVHHSPQSMVDTMLEHGGVWWGHNSGKYDGLQALEILRQGGLSQSVNLSGSRVTRSMGQGLTIRDSYGLVPMGLESLTRMAGRMVPRLWFDCHCGRDCGGYCSITRRMPPYMLARLVEYCIQDCEGVLYGLRALQEFADEHDYDLLGTIGGSAWATAKRVLDLLDADSGKNWPRIRDGYYGGRCSVFRPMVSVSGSHWDIGSAYPSALAGNWLPTGSPTERGSRSASTHLSAGTSGIYSCTMHVPGQQIPPIPWRWGNGISFPVGVVSGSWPLTEIEYAISVGCKVQAVHWAITWPRTENLFGDWIRGIYDVRSSVGRDSPFGQWLRLFPNSLGGKFAERPDKRFLRMNPPIADIIACPAKSPCTLTSCSGVCGAWEQVDKWGQMWSVPFYKPSPSGHIHWAAYMTAALRIQHHRELAIHGESAVYCDTDSLWTTNELYPADTGPGLGQWSRKCGFLEFEARAPKCYAYTDAATGEFAVCSAGAPMHPREWTTGESIQDRGVLSILDAAKLGSGLFHRAYRRWTLPVADRWYGDRIIDSGGMTRAVTTDELRIRLNERERERQSRRAENKARQ